jgi:hypothetical protein
MPPITTIAKIIAQQKSSHTATDRRFGAAAASLGAEDSAMALGTDTPCKCQQIQAKTRSLSDAASSRHPGDGRDPLICAAAVERWVPAFAGMTI